MKYLVHGTRTSVVSVEVEADSPEEAMELAAQEDSYGVDVWDTDFEWRMVFPS